MGGDQTAMSVTQSNQLEIVGNVLVGPCLSARYVRFGKFQIDTERQELFHDGERVRMQGKVYQALLLLVGRAGEIVTREEVGRRLWPERLPLSLDANVNTAMNKLRQGLGDSRESPVYIETIPRRGYCFIAPLEFADVATPPAAEPGSDSQQLAVESTYSRTRSRYTLAAALLLAGMVMGVLLTLAWFSFYNKSHKPLNSAADATSQPAASIRR